VEAGKPFTVTVESDAAAVSLMIQKEGEWESLVEYAMTKSDDSFSIKMTVTTVGLYRYFFRARLGGECVDFYADADLKPCKSGHRWVLLSYECKYDSPKWLEGGVMYQIFPDRFAIGGERLKTKSTMLYRSDWGGIPSYKPNAKGIIENRDMFGGNLLGVAEKLDYLLSLGVTCVYLNPIFEAASNHKYDTGSYRRVDGDFGGMKQLQILLHEAEKRGVQVILDGVFSHTGADSVYFNKYGTYDGDGAYNSEESPYYEWYKFEEYPDKYECWWGVKIHPNVDEDNPSYNEFINGVDGVVRSYIDMGTSGWRLDVADELPDKFLSNLTKAAKREKKDALVLGEVWENAATKFAYGNLRKYFWGGQLDSVTNYPLKEAVLGYLNTGSATELRRTVNNLVNDYPARNLNLLMNVIDTHDTPRALTLLASYPELPGKEDRSDARCLNYAEAVQKLKIAACIQFFMPGVPCVYYGDEAGMEGFEDPFNRRCYPWGNENEELLAYYKRLGAIRKALRDILSDGDYACDEEKDGAFVFSRTKGNKRVTVAVNCGKKNLRLGGERTDLISGKPLSELPELGFAVFLREI